MDDYLINGETLENIADKIREKAPEAYEGNTVTPEEMPDAVDEVWQAGYNEGSKSASENKPTDLTDLTFVLKEDIGEKLYYTVGAKYNVNFTSNGEDFIGFELCHDSDDADNYTHLQYWLSNTQSRNVYNYTRSSNSGNFSNNEYRTVTFTGGADVKNPDLIDLIYSIGVIESPYQTKHDETLETKSKEIVGAINEVNEKAIDKIDSIALTNYDAQSISTTDGLVWRDDSTFTIGEDDYDNIPTTHRVPIVAGENVTFEVDEQLKIVKINAKGGEADTSNLATVDKVKSIDTWAGGVSELDIDDGIYWTEEFAFFDEEELCGNEIARGDICHRIPIVAGNGIEFENDGQLITINATGGGSSENSILSVTVETDYPTTMFAIIEAIQSAGGDLSKLTFVTLTGYTTCNLMMSFQWRGGNYYRAECIDLGTMEKIYNPATDNSIYDVTSKRIGDFLQEGNQNEVEKVEMPQIRFTNANGYVPEDVTTFYVDEENPLKLTVEVTGGALQVGDQLQVCRRKRFDGSISNGYRRKFKLQRFEEYVVTEEDLNKRFLTVNVYLTDTTKRGLFRDGKAPTISPLYLRIRRAKGIMQNNDTGQTVDAEFSNIVTIWKSYHRSNQFIRIY